MITGKDLKSYKIPEKLKGQCIIKCTGVQVTSNGSLMVKNEITGAPEKFGEEVLGRPINDFLDVEFDNPQRFREQWMVDRAQKKLYEAISAYGVAHEGLEFEETDLIGQEAKVYIDIVPNWRTKKPEEQITEYYPR